MATEIEKYRDDWTPFGVESKTSDGRTPLEIVTHVTHVQHGLEIMRTTRIRSRLIYDNSRLNKKRALVAWLSPNRWVHGFRYGNVAFDFEWKKLIKDKNYYWVEVMDYKPSACRILITDQDRKLLRYEPKKGDGPWYWDRSTDQHWWNGNYCLEFMYEGDLSLDDAKEIRFVNHHDIQCNITPITCKDCKLDSDRAGVYFLSAIAAEKILVPDHLFPGDHGNAKNTMTKLCGPWSRLYRVLKNMPTEGKSTMDAAEKAAYARAVFASFARRDIKEAKYFAKVFKSNEKLVKTCATLLNNALQLEGIRQLPTTDEQFD
jgi:hypothetical protein